MAESIIREIKNVQVTVYQYKTIDGKIFDNEREAYEHEKKYYAEKGIKDIKVKRFKRFDGDIFGMDYNSWYFIENKEQLENVINYYKYTWDRDAKLGRYYQSKNPEDYIGDWLGVYVDCSYDYESVWFCSLKSMKDEINRISDRIKEIEF